MDYEEIQAEIEKGVDASELAVADTKPDTLTLRERWRRTMFFQRVDRIPNFEFGYWAETLGAWHKQGLPPEVNDEASAYAYFGIEDSKSAPIDVMGLRPGFDPVKDADSPELQGIAIARLAADPDLMLYSGKVQVVTDLAARYGFVDIDGAVPKGSPRVKWLREQRGSIAPLAYD